MSKKTYNDVIDEFIQGIKDQKGRSIDNETCKYISNDGKKCAVGLFLNDPKTIEEIYSNEPISYINDCERTFTSLLKGDYYHLDNLDFWVELQLIHDTSEYWSNEIELSVIGENRIERLRKSYT